MAKKLTRLGLISAAAVALTATAAQADPLKIGALMPMTGDLQAYGETCHNGILLAVEEINKQGGVLGSNVVMTVGDTQTAPQAAVDAATKLVNIGNVDAMVGALSSGSTIPVAKSVAATRGVPMISPASTSPEITGLADGDFLFRTVPTDAIQGVALAQLTIEKGIKSVGVIYINNDYGKGLADAFSAAYVNIGGKVTATSGYEPKQPSYRGELQKAAKGRPEALVLVGYPENGQTIIRQALEGAVFTKFIFTDGLKAPEIIANIGAEYLNGSFGTAPEARGAANERFKEAYRAKFGELPPKPYIDSSYDAVMLIALAAEKARSTDPKAIRDALRAVASPPGKPIMPGEFAKAQLAINSGQDVDYVGASGPLNFDSAGDVAGTYAHWEIKDGKIVTVKVFEPK
ncbi:ABC transporter substrate-binding protein [Magnetospira sp. QH-2]|uniref:ABC transporter substrate-binding protein n=1 Tax=Magnetospira sp. (strain QH-2) TaxID=1288970 RepID=UPI0003E8146F|nr:ABC transporter substrate-binding protein [Magnetospira sp. QH-2]CCQ73836.1 Putative high-affinity branched-chain amino acid transport system periplasmic-binding component LivK [Magnetospira sp. QH-2]